MENNKVCFAMGNEAFTEGAIAAGARFYGGYPITPSSEIAELSAARLPQEGGVYIQMEDEIASLASVIGASASGKKAYTATSGPGFTLMQEILGIGIATETPCVLVDVQRNGPSTGVATKPAQGDFMQAKYGTHGDHSIIAISPSSVQECYDFAITAFNLAEKYRTPVIFLMDGCIGHLYETYTRWTPTEKDIINRAVPTCKPEEYLPFDIGEGDRIPPMATFGSPYLQHLSGSAHDFTGTTCDKVDMVTLFDKHFVDKIEKNRKDITIVREFELSDAEYIIVTFGCSTRAARAAMQEARDKGIKVGVLQLVTVWPFPEEEILKAAKQAKTLIVAEMNLGQMVGEVRRVVEGRCPVKGVHKATTEIIKPNEIIQAIEEAMNV